MKKKLLILFVFIFLVMSSLSAKVTAVTTTGTPLENTEAGVNYSSTLAKTWVVIKDDKCPIQYVEVPGIDISYYLDNSSRNRTEYTNYRSVNDRAEFSGKIMAYEAVAVIFDVFNEYYKTIKTRSIRDREMSQYTEEEPFEVNFYEKVPKEDLAKLASSITFISKVRMEDGTIYKANADEIVKAAKEYFPSITVENLGL